MIKRIYDFNEIIDSGNSLVIIGPRGVGKSYFFDNFINQTNIKNIRIDLLSRDEYSKYLSFPSALYEEVKTKVKQIAENRLIVFIDEIQLIPDLLHEIHRLIEEFQGQVVFILTGSSARKLRKNNVNLLAGRLLSFRFFSFSMQEVDCSTSLLQVLRYGLLPKAYLENDAEVRELYLKSYVQSYLREEIQQEALVRNIPVFNRFLELAAQRDGAVTNYTKLSKIIKISPATIKQYYQILEDTLIVFRIPARTHSVKKQLIQAEKFYFFDCGVLNALLGQLKLELGYGSNFLGNLFENFIVNEIIKYNTIQKCDFNIFHYRTNTGKEIDLILQQHPFSEPIAIEIKSSDYPQPEDVKSLKQIKDDYPKARLVVLCRTKNDYHLEGIEFLNWQSGIESLFSNQSCS